MVKEMVGGCCVCSDERGWDENPLVYCDGHGCNVAVHQGELYIIIILFCVVCIKKRGTGEAIQKALIVVVLDTLVENDYE